MFPVYEPQEVITATTGKKTFQFNFQTGDFEASDGKVKILNDAAALKMRIEKVLKTEKFKFKVYEKEGDEYGITLLEYVNSGFPQQFIQSEIEREIVETITKDPDVTAVYDFVFSRGKRTLTATFKVNSIYGEVLEFGI